MKPFIPRSDSEFVLWLERFADALPEFASQLGMSAAQVAAVQGASQVFSAALDAKIEAERAAMAATAAKDEAREVAEALVRQLSRIAQASPEITTEIRALLGLSDRKPRVHRRRPEAPQGLVCEIIHGREHHLKWDRAGNPTNASFVIESRAEGDANWETVGLTSRTRWSRVVPMSGRATYYRIRAHLPAGLSLPSNSAMAGMPSLGLAA